MTSSVFHEVEPIEYSNNDVKSDVSQDTKVFTDVQESKEGDTEVGPSITSHYYVPLLTFHI